MTDGKIEHSGTGPARLEVYTDGSCLGNPGPGGWGVVLIHPQKTKEMSGGYAHTTNNRMEMTAAIEALKALKEKCRVTLYTDSNYLRQGITQWMAKWKRNSWKTADKRPVKNQDLWMELDRVLGRHEVDFKWVKGHAGNKYNEICDRLAVAAAKQKNLPPDTGYVG